MHVCDTHKNGRSVRAVSVLQKNVRATGVCTRNQGCTPVLPTRDCLARCFVNGLLELLLKEPFVVGSLVSLS